MDQYELGVTLAVGRIVEFRRQADRWRLASRISGLPGGRHRNKPPGPPRLPGRRGQAGGGVGGTHAAAAVAASGPGGGNHGAAMLIQHQHKPGDFDPGHCRECARRTDPLGHYHRVQREEQAFKEATGGLGGPAATRSGTCG
jgi:hypothetical protein